MSERETDDEALLPNIATDSVLVQQSEAMRLHYETTSYDEIPENWEALSEPPDEEDE